MLSCERCDFFHDSFFIEHLTRTIVTKPRDGHETVSNMRVVYIESFEQFTLQIKPITLQTMLDVYCKHDFRLQTWGSLVYLEGISISLDKDNDLEEEITHLLMKFFFQASRNKHDQIGSKYIPNMYIITA